MTIKNYNIILAIILSHEENYIFGNTNEKNYKKRSLIRFKYPKKL